jgi:hypothetical protein
MRSPWNKRATRRDSPVFRLSARSLGEDVAMLRAGRHVPADVQDVTSLHYYGVI